jgi:plasmid stabilization system protein ParE
MAELNWTAEAERWLSEIYTYIAKDNPAAAAAFSAARINPTTVTEG